MDRALAVPMVTARVSRRETYAQIVTALTALDEASASVFDGVAARVDAQRARLADIDARLARANARIAALAANASDGPAGSAAHGSTRNPIVVTAPARFPSRAAPDSSRRFTATRGSFSAHPRRRPARHTAPHAGRARRRGDGAFPAT